MTTTAIESKILEKAERQARTDVENFKKSICAIDLAGEFTMKCHTGEHKSISVITEYYLKENTTNYNKVMEQLTEKYVRQYTNDLLSKMQHLKEFLESGI